MSLDASESLRQQFQLIQEQQQRKLLARKQRKTKNSEKTAKEDEDVAAENFWGHDKHSDNLDLKVCIIFEFLLLLCDPYDKYDAIHSRQLKASDCFQGKIRYILEAST